MKTQRTGFTLVELMVVVTIITLLVSMLMPAMESAFEAARKAKCAANLHTIHIGVYQSEVPEGYSITEGDRPAAF